LKGKKETQEYFDDDDDVMLDDPVKEDEKHEETPSLSSNPLVKSAAERIPFLIE
jgi:hypothetical protein